MAMVTPTDAGRILVLNAGSSNLKLAVFAEDGEELLAEDDLTWRSHEDKSRHATALKSMLSGVELSRISAVGHRVVHGGERFREAVRIDDSVKREIGNLVELAPLHNPAALDVINSAESILPGIPHIAVFDTAFHATLQPAQFIYPLPYRWYEAWGIRRFGFHGLSHSYCANRAAELLGRPIERLRMVSCHLGAGCSLAAVDAGKSVATTMGFTPLDGIPMASRAGALDPGIILYLLKSGHLSVDEMDDALTYESGLMGMSSISGDMRDILAARNEGNERASLSFDVFTNRISESIAALTATLGGIDAIIFTGGIGEHAADVRAAVCRRLTWMGVQLDGAANATSVPDVDIGLVETTVRIVVIHSREDLVIARETYRNLYNG
jgi:acetate kinase